MADVADASKGERIGSSNGRPAAFMGRGGCEEQGRGRSDASAMHNAHQSLLLFLRDGSSLFEAEKIIWKGDGFNQGLITCRQEVMTNR